MVPLRPPIDELARTFTTVDGQLLLPPSDAASWKKKLAEIAPEEHEACATDILALAIHFRSAGEVTERAVDQLLELAAAVLRKHRSSKDSLAPVKRHGVADRRAEASALTPPAPKRPKSKRGR